MGDSPRYSWKIVDCPTLNNDINILVRKMNNYGNLPWPYSKFAELCRIKLKTKLVYLKDSHFDYNFYCAFGNLHGEGVWFTNTYILDYAPVYFGKHITIGPDVKIITSWHEISNFNIVKAEPIVIEDNVWITMNAIILPGVTIGENSIIGAGSVVTKSVPPNSLVGGNPAQVINQIKRDYPYWDELKNDIDKMTLTAKSTNILKQIGCLIPSFIKDPLRSLYLKWSPGLVPKKRKP
jgi:acetyltransferase-like isoleucine patch superfamily enzyme